MPCEGCKFLNTLVVDNISWYSCAIESDFFSYKNNLVCTEYLPENTENEDEEML
jgi:hypothetical protein